ncbi:MAG: glycine cleavage system protein R [Acidimicrobiia bacterium]
MATYVLTAIGDDRAGLVSALADVVAEHGGNWERSQLAELAGKFAGIVMVTVPDARADELVAALDSLEGVLEVQAHRGGTERPESQRVALELMGTDRPGIVREISAVLARHGVSIDQLVTATREAPMAGGMLFEADAVLDVPAGTTAATLRAALESVAGELMVDIDLEDL